MLYSKVAVITVIIIIIIITVTGYMEVAQVLKSTMRRLFRATYIKYTPDP